VGSVAGLMVVFTQFHDRFRRLEGAAAVDLLHVFGVPENTVQSLGGVLLAVIPPGHNGFLVYVAPGCSSLAALLSLVLLVLFTPRGLGWWRLCAPVAAILCVLTGNILRLAGSLGFGLVAGRESSVLFHDWAGTIFSYIYTVGGYLMMLWLLLSVCGRRRAKTEESDVD
jgi:exosortase/archaeosortase family protein